MLLKHSTEYPAQSTPLSDTATSLGGKPRVPAPEKSFLPVGHITLESEHADRTVADASKGLYRIATFWVSGVLQGCGLGRASMDTIEAMAINEPLNAKTLALDTAARDSPDRAEKFLAFGMVMTKVCSPASLFWSPLILFPLAYEWRWDDCLHAAGVYS